MLRILQTSEIIIHIPHKSSNRRDEYCGRDFASATMPSYLILFTISIQSNKKMKVEEEETIRMKDKQR